MRTTKLLVRLTLYYLALSGLLALLVFLYPPVVQFLPVGGVEALLTAPADGPLGTIRVGGGAVGNFGESLVWLVIAIIGSLIAALPVSWTYMEVRDRRDYDQSLVQTIVLMPMIVTSIIIVVHNSLALAFSLAGIAAGVRFRNALRSPGDALFILVAIAIGLSGGIGAMELAIVMSIAFNYMFLILWINNYGARKGAPRYMRKSEASGEAEEPEAEGAAEPAT